MRVLRLLPFLLVVALVAAACGSSPSSPSTGDGDEGLHVVATTSIVGDLVAQVIGDAGEVEVLMPPGSDPHTFSASAAQAAAVRDADVVVAVGLGLEESLQDLLDAARGEGVEVIELTEFVDTIPVVEELGHDHDEDEEGAHEDDPEDPHIWFDPSRMATAVEQLGPALVAATGGSEVGVAERATALAAELRELDVEVEEILAGIPEERRVLITNHDAVGYLADRYDLRIVGTVVPGGSTMSSPSADRLAELAELVRELDVPAIFAETTADGRLAETLAREVGRDVAVVTLFTDALGPEGSGAESYTGLMRTDARLIADALGGGGA